MVDNSAFALARAKCMAQCVDGKAVGTHPQVNFNWPVVWLMDSCKIYAPRDGESCDSWFDQFYCTPRMMTRQEGIRQLGEDFLYFQHFGCVPYDAERSILLSSPSCETSTFSWSINDSKTEADVQGRLASAAAPVVVRGPRHWVS